MEGRVSIVLGFPCKELKKAEWPNLSRLPELGHTIRAKNGAEAKVKGITHCEDKDGPYVELLVESTTVML